MAALTMANCDWNSCPVAEGFLSEPPHLAGNAFLLASFAALIPLNVYFGVLHGTALYTLVFVTGLALEIVGHIGKIMLRDELTSRTFFTMYMVGSTTGPTFITAAVFVVLPHILSVYGERFFVIPSPLWIGMVFFGLDVFTLAFQIVGCVFAVDGVARPDMGQGVNILLAGLGIQVASLVLFYVVYYSFLFKLAGHPELLETNHAKIYLTSRFKATVIGLQTAAVFILARTVTRIVQLSAGMDSDIFQSQTLDMVLDSAFVLLAGIVLTFAAPGAAFGSRAWRQTSPHMVGSSRRRREAEGANYALQPNYSDAQNNSPYHFTPSGPREPKPFEHQTPAHWQYPNLHKAPPRPQPIRVAPYRAGEDGIARGSVVSSAGMQPGSAGSQGLMQPGSAGSRHYRDSKRLSPRQGDMVDEEALWG